MSDKPGLFTRLMTPLAPPYDPVAWSKTPLGERLQLVCRSWALQGYGTPPLVFVVYLLKVGFYVGGWLFACTAVPGYALAEVTTWWLTPIAFQKAIVWSMLFEVIGLGCGSGPLTGRYHPPFGGALYFLRPGTTKLPPFPKLPLVGGYRRGWLEVLLYLGLVGSLSWACMAPALGTGEFAPIAGTLLVLGLTDRTPFLAARAEHYWVTVLCFLFAGNWIAGAKAVQLALWFWAGVSKLNHHFPAVVCVMTSNSPVLRFRRLREKMYRDFPNDLRPSDLAVKMAHLGTFLELSVPMILLAGSGGTLTAVGMVMMLMLHGFITSNVPMGVPIEWNVMVVYGAFFLFGENAAVSLTAIGSVPLTVFLVGTLVLVPLLGNLFPERMSFLLAMRYYAGNWAFSVWLFRDESYRKLDQHLTKASAWVMDQLARFYDESTAIGLVGKVIAFRAMHLHGRSLQKLVPRAVDTLDNRTWVDGEVVAGMVLGWNFGDGHLHQDALLEAVQAQCKFEPGELRCIFVESQPLFRSGMSYRVVDAASGVIDEGQLEVRELRELQPWPSVDAAR